MSWPRKVLTWHFFDMLACNSALRNYIKFTYNFAVICGKLGKLSTYCESGDIAGLSKTFNPQHHAARSVATRCMR